MALSEKIVFGQRILGYFILVFITFFMCVLISSHAYDKINVTFCWKEIISLKRHVKLFSMCT